MRGGVLPPALLFAALAFMLAFAPRRVPAMAAALIAAVLAARAPVPPGWIEPVFLGAWASVVVTAALVHRRGGAGARTALVLAVNAGMWAGATVALTGSLADVALAAPPLLLAVPAAWLAGSGRGIAVKVGASWLIAVALLAAVLPLVPTPGYAPDHIE